ncbi:hypothetical protein KY290_022689 [Solanum tuberosum]|uniref:Uncharacterized protein n=1 Tax=Solanum tuberosum TaxID=4113 RepID=A0ABQ7V574_SOLTU|nr:hypothetical protein KY290_022689 [Solanum tuberosum]
MQFGLNAISGTCNDVILGHLQYRAQCDLRAQCNLGHNAISGTMQSRAHAISGTCNLGHNAISGTCI